MADPKFTQVHAKPACRSGVADVGCGDDYGIKEQPGDFHFVSNFASLRLLMGGKRTYNPVNDTSPVVHMIRPAAFSFQ